MTDTVSASVPARASAPGLPAERADLLDVLHKHRELFRSTVTDLTDDQARLRSTVSELTLGGIVKHVSIVERQWADFIVNGPAAQRIDWSSIDWSNPPAELLTYQNGFRMVDGETLDGLLAEYAAVAAATDELVATADLNATHPLPEAPWFEPGGRWSVRRVFLHVAMETAQHAGHADIIRESIDGRKSMG